MKLIYLMMMSLFLIACGDDASEEVVDHCNHNPCRGWEICVPSSGACILDEGRCNIKSECGGDLVCDDNHNCVDPVDPCKDITCGDRGTCVIDATTQMATCGCDMGYFSSGLNCIKKDPCADLVCNSWEECNPQRVQCELKEGMCDDHSDCIDPLHCNGVERCNETTHLCEAGENPCVGQGCSESAEGAVCSSGIDEMITSGDYHNLYIKKGALYAWGDNTKGQLGNGKSGDEVRENVATRIGSDSDWSDVAAGREHSCGIRGGALYCWGDNYFGQLGINSTEALKETPQKVGSDTTWEKVSTRYNTTCGINAGKLYCWGNNDQGMLGIGRDELQVDYPVQVGNDTTWSDISSGITVTCGINDQKVYCWGSEGYGQLGNGVIALDSFKNTPQSVGSALWYQVAAGDTHVCGIQGSGETGSLYCWGGNPAGELGNGKDGNDEMQAAPVRVGSLSGWSVIDTGSNFSCGIERGTLYCWGLNVYGALGHGGLQELDNQNQPKQVGSDTTWTHMSTGNYHTCGINESGVYCWGYNYFGQVGNGTDGDYYLEFGITSPVKVVGLNSK